MLYSEKFHWLLIEDFAWQGRTQPAEGSVKREEEEGEKDSPGQQIQTTDDEDLPSKFVFQIKSCLVLYF